MIRNNTPIFINSTVYNFPNNITIRSLAIIILYCTCASSSSSTSAFLIFECGKDEWNPNATPFMNLPTPIPGS